MNQPKSIFYLHVQKRLLEHCDENKIIELAKAKSRLKFIKFPKQLVPIVLKEMEKCGLIETIDRYKVRVINCSECKKIEKTNKIYGEAGIW